MTSEYLYEALFAVISPAGGTVEFSDGVESSLRGLLFELLSTS